MTAKIVILIACLVLWIGGMALMRYCEKNVYLKYKEVKR